MTRTDSERSDPFGDYLELILDPDAEDFVGLDSQFRAAAADAVLACYELDGPAPEYRHHRAVNEAADVYTAALNCAHPHTYPAGVAAEEARLKRNQYIREHRHLHATAASLLQATADYLRDLAGQTR